MLRLQEALFQLQLSQVEAGARHGAGPVSGKECARVGRTPPTAEEVVAMTAARAAVLAEEEAHRQQAALHRCALPFPHCTVASRPGAHWHVATAVNAVESWTAVSETAMLLSDSLQCLGAVTHSGTVTAVLCVQQAAA